MSLNEVALEDAKKSLSIRDVYFRDEMVVVDEGVTPPFLPSNIKTHFKMVTRILHDFEVEVPASAEQEPTRKRFLEIEFEGSVRCLNADTKAEESKFLLEATVSIGLLYQVTKACSDESLEEFVRMNAPYHAIPYWREHVHSVCAKRRFPSVTVPMYQRAIRARDRQTAPDKAPEGNIGTPEP